MTSDSSDREPEDAMGRVIVVEASLLSRYLKSFRARINIPIEKPQRAMDKFFEAKLVQLKSEPTKNRSYLCRLYEEHTDRLVHALENPKQGRTDPFIKLHTNDLAVLADAYRISPLMLVPLLTSTSNRVSLELDASDFHPVPIQFWRHREHESRQKAAYYFPKERAANTEDIAIVRLELSPGSRSDLHAHPGDEIIIVLSGKVGLYLDTTGTLTTLSQFDYAHFYAEQLHGLMSVDDAIASVLIVRFYQFDSASVRAKVLKEFQDQVAVGKKEDDDHNLANRRGLNATQAARLLSELTSLLECRDVPPQLRPLSSPVTPESMVDRHGFARFLDLVSSKTFRETNSLTRRMIASKARELSKQNPAFGVWADRNAVQGLHDGTSIKPIQAIELPVLADLYEVTDVLLYDFLFPAITNCVIVRCPVHVADPSLNPSVDWPWDYWSYSKSQADMESTQYWIPRRRLANSDLACALLQLRAGERSPENRHPGWELLVPLRGGFRIVLDGNEQLVVSEKGNKLAHYPSDRLHYVVEDNGTESLALVLRFYQSKSKVVGKSRKSRK